MTYGIIIRIIFCALSILQITQTAQEHIEQLTNSVYPQIIHQLSDLAPADQESQNITCSSHRNKDLALLAACAVPPIITCFYRAQQRQTRFVSGFEPLIASTGFKLGAGFVNIVAILMAGWKLNSLVYGNCAEKKIQRDHEKRLQKLEFQTSELITSSNGQQQLNQKVVGKINEIGNAVNHLQDLNSVQNQKISPMTNVIPRPIKEKPSCWCC